nr:MAG TPA: hypothetical protein [Caudoviricetes sp.]
MQKSNRTISPDDGRCWTASEGSRCLPMDSDDNGCSK